MQYEGKNLLIAFMPPLGPGSLREDMPGKEIWAMGGGVGRAALALVDAPAEGASVMAVRVSHFAFSVATCCPQLSTLPLCVACGAQRPLAPWTRRRVVKTISENLICHIPVGCESESELIEKQKNIQLTFTTWLTTFLQ